MQVDAPAAAAAAIVETWSHWCPFCEGYFNKKGCKAYAAPHGCIDKYTPCDHCGEVEAKRQLAKIHTAHRNGEWGVEENTLVWSLLDAHKKHRSKHAEERARLAFTTLCVSYVKEKAAEAAVEAAAARAAAGTQKSNFY